MHKYLIILITIVVIGMFLRFYKLGEIPNGLYRDETAIGYNAYSILKTGKDEHGKKFPLYFKSFGDWKLPVYIYLTVPSVYFFGLTPFAVRLPSAAAGVLTIVILAELLRILFKRTDISLMAAIILAINPWHLHYSRATFEVSIGLFMLLTGTYLIYQSLLSRFKVFFIAGIICYFIALYSYNLTRLLMPVWLTGLMIINRKSVRNLPLSIKLLSCLVLLLLLLPLIFTIGSKGGLSSTGGTLIFTSGQIKAEILEIRSFFAEWSYPIRLVFSNLPLLAFKYLRNIISYLSVEFFFVNGSSHGNHGIGNFGLFYPIELPLLIIGVICVIKKKTNGSTLMLFFAITTIAVSSLTREAPHATRSFFLLPSVIFFITEGAVITSKFLKQINSHYLKVFANIILVVIIIYPILYYFGSYYIRFPIYYAKAWSAKDKEVSDLVASLYDKSENIIIDKKSGLSYTSLLFYLKISPTDFLGAKWSPDDTEGFSFPVGFSKFEFKDVDWKNDLINPYTLIITAGNIKPTNISSYKTIYYPKRPVVISNKEQISQFPVEDIAYEVIFKTAN